MSMVLSCPKKMHSRVMSIRMTRFTSEPPHALRRLSAALLLPLRPPCDSSMPALKLLLPALLSMMRSRIQRLTCSLSASSLVWYGNSTIRLPAPLLPVASLVTLSEVTVLLLSPTAFCSARKCVLSRNLLLVSAILPRLSAKATFTITSVSLATRESAGKMYSGKMLLSRWVNSSTKISSARRPLSAIARTGADWSSSATRYMGTMRCRMMSSAQCRPRRVSSDRQTSLDCGYLRCR